MERKQCPAAPAPPSPTTNTIDPGGFPAVANERRLSRAALIEAIAFRFTDLLTTIIGRCDISLRAEPDHASFVAELGAIRSAALQAAELNYRIFPLIQECRNEARS